MLQTPSSHFEPAEADASPADASEEQELPPIREALAQLKHLTHVVRPYWRPVMKLLVLGPLLGLVGLVPPYLSKMLIDRVYPAQDTTLMHVIVGGIFALSVGSLIVKSIKSYYGSYIDSTLSGAARLMFFNHMQHLSMQFYNDHRVGEVMSRFSDVAKGIGTISSVLKTMLGSGVYLLLVPPFLFLLQWKLALLALACVPLTAVLTVFTARFMRRYWRRTTEAYAEVGAVQYEALSQVSMIKALALERHIYEATQNRVRSAIEVQLKTAGYSTAFGVVSGLVKSVNTLLITWYGWTLIIGQEMTLGEYIAFTSYIGYMYGPISGLVGLISKLQQSAVYLRRMFEYLDEPPEQDPNAAYEVVNEDGSSAEPSVRIDGRIAFDDVSFAYEPDQPVLRGIHLRIEPGTFGVIVGASGSGKTSLLRLIARLAEVDRGMVRVDDEPVQAYPLHDFRRQVVTVLQHTSLLQGTIWYNLTLGLDEVDPAAVNAVVDACEMSSHIEHLPDGYNTTVAEWGASLSGGQRQRLALAQALLRNAPILLMDEATSNLDVTTEKRVLDAVRRRRRGKTTLFATHRLAVAELADVVYVMHQGQIVAEGTHDDLLHSSRLYRQIQNEAGYRDASSSNASDHTNYATI